MKLFVNCRAYAFDPATRRCARHDALLVDEARIAALGAAQAGAGIERVDLHGATVIPALADCHVHLTDTGYTTGARNLGDVRDARTFEARIAALPRDERLVYAANYDDADWPDGEAGAEPLERHHGDRFAMLVRVDGHSSLVNRAAFAALALDRSLEGIERDAGGEPTGRLFLDANWTAQGKLFALMPLAQRRAAERRAYALALEQGALNLHVQLVGFQTFERYAEEIEALRALGPARWYPKICEPAPQMAVQLGLPFVGGDVFLDGSIGSRTAALSQAYCDGPGSGRLTYTDAEVERFFGEAEALGVSAGVHAIGDRAIEQCIATWERVLGGRPSPRNRHFIEHFEVATADQVRRCAQLGLILSMQPQFDATWGGESGMYARRLGAARARAMNPLRSALAAGATLAGGDDSPVCALSPLAGMDAACRHHTSEERLAPLEALTMYTYDAARLAHAERTTGTLQPGYAADFVLLDRDPFGDGSFARTQVLETWCDGERLFVR